MELDAVEARIASALRQQLCVRPPFDDGAVMQHEDDIRVTDRGKPVRDRD